MSPTAKIAGVGMTRFGRHDASVRELASSAARAAIKDAGLEARDIDAVFFSNSMQGLLDGQESIRGHVALQEFGLAPGTPVTNVEAACASGSSALALAHAACAAGGGTLLVVGVEKLYIADRSRALRALLSATDVTTLERVDRNVYLEYYANELRRRLDEGSVHLEHVAAVAVKNSRHGARNPLAQFRVEHTVTEVLSSPTVEAPLTKLMCSPMSDGAAAIVVSATGKGPRIEACVAQGPGFSSDSDLIASAAARAYEQAAIGPEDVGLFEVHDATASAELSAYEGLGLCSPGGAGELIERGITDVGGRWPVNVSGGLLSRGHPVGATGVAQIVELALHLEGRAVGRQVDGVNVAVAENHGGLLLGAPAAACVTVLRR